MGITDTDRQATRAELNKLNDQIELVSNGKNRLEEIQEQLIDEFMNVFDKWQEENTDINQHYDEAQHKLDITRAMEGKVRLNSISKSRSGKIKIETSVDNIAGVKVPKIVPMNDVKTDLDSRGYGVIGSNARIDEVAESYEELVESLVRLAEIETTMRRLLEEIERVSRRINAFEYQILPDLRSERKRIERHLMEQERQQVYQLKMIKDKSEEN